MRDMKARRRVAKPAIKRGSRVQRTTTQTNTKTHNAKLLAALGIVALIVQLTVPSGVSASAGSVKTVTGSCGAPVNANHYSVGDHVFVNATGFDPATSFSWDISPVPSGAAVASGTELTDASGNICFDAYTVQAGDNGEYKVTFGDKHDNYQVGDSVILPGTGSLTVNKVTVGGDGTFNFSGTGPTDIANFQITTVTNTGSTTLDNLTEGSYTITEDTGSLGAGWSQTDSTCANVQVTADQTASCTITNTFKSNDGGGDQPNPVNIDASKVVCLATSDLPDWGTPGAAGRPSQITATTAADFVAASKGRCHLESGWSFQYGFAEHDNTAGVDKLPGNFVGPADGTSTLGMCNPTYCGTNTNTGTNYNDWKNFDTSTAVSGTVPAQVSISDLQGAPGIWVREDLKDGYIPFTYPPDPTPGSNISAEMLCNSDMLNYDNYDEITNPVAGQTYYCMAINVPKSVEIQSYKVVCLSESDLPDWGTVNAVGKPAQITATTAADYVAASQGRCHLEADWSFQYGFATKDGSPGVDKLPGDHIGPADGTDSTGLCDPNFCGINTNTGTNYNDWKNFDTSTASAGAIPAQVNISDLQSAPGIWVREDLKDGYIPFTYPPDPSPGSDISAEIYCHTDIQNFDNYDEIVNPQIGNTYYCVAFNAPKTVTIKAYKVVCLSESNLPDWGDGSGSGKPTQITATTASDYVAASDGQCSLQPDWSFQYGFAEKDGQSGVDKLPGDFVGPADGTSTLGQCNPTFCGNNTFTGTGYADWKNFDTSTSSGGAVAAQVDVSDLQGAPGIWVREDLQNGYIPFSYPPDGPPGSNNSAEIYCHTDIHNFDNYDEVSNPVVGNTYYCVAFNVLKSTDNGGGNGDCVSDCSNGGSNNFILKITTSGDGSGNVAGSGIDCSTGEPVTNTCTDTYPAGTVVNLTVTPGDGSNFDGTWSTILGDPGTCTSNALTCTLTMNSDVTLNAHFALNVVTSSVVGGGGGGSGGGGGGSGPVLPGSVLGANTTNPNVGGGSSGPTPQVLGAATTLPRTGTSEVALIIITMLALLPLTWQILKKKLA